MKKVTLVFPLYLAATFYGKIFEKEKCLELVTSLFELQDMLKNISFLVLPFESGNCVKRSRKTTKD